MILRMTTDAMAGGNVVKELLLEFAGDGMAINRSIRWQGVRGEGVCHSCPPGHFFSVARALSLRLVSGGAEPLSRGFCL